MLKILFALAICGIVGCTAPPPDWKVLSEKRVDNVARVFMNDPNEYVIFTQVDNRLVPKTYKGFINVITDAPNDKSMYLIVKEIVQDNRDAYPTYGTKSLTVDIHVHDAQAIGTGHWQRHLGNDPPRQESVPVIPIK